MTLHLSPRTSLRRLLATAAVMLAVVSAVPAQAQQAGRDAVADVVAQQTVRIGELERLVQDLTGRVEEAQFRNRQLQQRLDQLTQDVDFRLQRIEQAAGLTAAGPAPTADGSGPAFTASGTAGGAPDAAGSPPAQSAPPQSAPPQPASGAVAAPPPAAGQPGVFGYLPGTPGQGQAQGSDRPQLLQPGQAQPQPQSQLQPQPQAGTAAPAAGQQAALPTGTPEEQYNQAFALLRGGNYAGAEQALKAFLAAHPQHELAGNAQYWLGESFYVRGDYKQAAVAFLDGYRNYPKSAKGPDNLLKLGVTMGQIGQSKEACAAFQKLSSDYPQASDVIKRRAASERDKLGCR